MIALEVADWRRRVFRLVRRGAGGHRPCRGARPLAAHARRPVRHASGDAAATRGPGRLHRPPCATVRSGLAVRGRGHARPRRGTWRSRPEPTASCPSTCSGSWRCRGSGHWMSGDSRSYGGGIFVPDQGRAARQARRHLRRRPLPARHHQGRRPRARVSAGLARARLQLRLQPVVRLRPGVGVPARPAGKHDRWSRSRWARRYSGSY